MSKTVIGITGVKTSGKSTAASMIGEFLKVKEVALADKLKDTCAKVFDLERIQFDSQRLKEIPFENPKLLDISRIDEILKSFNIELVDEILQKYFKNGIEGMTLSSPRHIAQIVGTEVLRAAGNEDIHCDNIDLDGEIIVVSDLRFPNEFEYFSKMEGIKFVPLYIQRDEAESLVTEDSHPSEKCVFDFADKCIKIDNNGSFSDMEKQINDIIAKYIQN